MVDNPTPAVKVNLLPCPFCGAAPSVADEDGVTLYWHPFSKTWQVACDGCRVQTAEGRDKVAAAAVWNTRAALFPATDNGEVEHG